MPSITQHICARTRIRTRACLVYQIPLIIHRKRKNSKQVYNTYLKPFRHRVGNKQLAGFLQCQGVTPTTRSLGNILKQVMLGLQHSHPPASLFYHPGPELPLLLESFQLLEFSRTLYVVSHSVLLRLCNSTSVSSTRETKQGASLAAQWLRICLPMQGTRVRALVWEDPTCRGATGPVSHNY